MNIQLLSDIHLEFEELHYKAADCDVVVLAGDIHVKDKAIDWILKNIPDKPVVYVMGNHEFYGKALPKHIDTLREKCRFTNIHLLENDAIQIEDVNFLGCTLWTDFALYGDPKFAGMNCQSQMNDYKKIRLSPRFSRLRSIDTAMTHQTSIQWLEQALCSLQGQKNVVVTHHGPSEKSIPREYKGGLFSAAYVSDLDHFILKHQPKYWLHGHLHNSSIYQIGECLVVCNPRGYPGEFNPDFDDALVLAI